MLRGIKNDQMNSLQKQANWEFMKYKSRKFFFHTARAKAREKRRVQSELENRLKTLEGTPNFNHNEEYLGKKQDLEDLYENQVEGARIRSKVRDYEQGEKSNKYFLNLEKHHAKMSSIRKLNCDDGRVVSTDKDINNELHKFYRNLYANGSATTSPQIAEKLHDIELKSLNQNEI